MTKFLQLMFLAFIWLFEPAGLILQTDRDSSGSRTRREIHCRDNLEYLNGNICCLNCPAGTRLVLPCTTEGAKGKCEECDDGTFTEHTNSLQQCFKCTQCRSDQEIVRVCSHTHDTECQCKSGRFCAPDQACEVCKKCSRCEQDEEIVRNCTSTANTECKKIQPKPDSASGINWLIGLLVLFAVVVGMVIIAICVYPRYRRATGSQGNQTAGLKTTEHHRDNCPTEEGRNRVPGRLSSSILHQQLVSVRSSAHMEDERKMLCESLNSSASNSQHSLTGLHPYAVPAPPPQASPMVPRLPDRREDEPFPTLVPVNGEDSLRKCFDFFEEIDVDYHKRFFRHLGITDNVIKSKEHHLYEDKIHELLNIWVEKEGRDASLNDLLKALLDLNQRRTAETIKENAVGHGHYLCEE